ncbi:hypothetical protein DFJ73DRAFT_781793 [Zopfochytrium polystomum]|nr:hypothetical protein DFJ73DRAFT_781793 [Zopfochytrium polystomum]
MPLVAESQPRLAIAVMATCGVLPVFLNASSDSHRTRKIFTCTAAVSLSLWAVVLTMTPNFAGLTAALACSCLRSLFLGVAISIAAYPDALVLAATIPHVGPLKTAVCLSVTRFVVSYFRDTYNIGTPDYVTLNKAVLVVIALELLLAASVSLVSLVRIMSVLQFGGTSATRLLMTRRAFTIEVVFYAGSAFVVLILGYIGLYDIASAGVAINTAEVQYILRSLTIWGSGGVEHSENSTVRDSKSDASKTGVSSGLRTA